MKRKRYSEERIIRILKSTAGPPITAAWAFPDSSVCMSWSKRMPATSTCWRQHYGNGVRRCNGGR